MLREFLNAEGIPDAYTLASALSAGGQDGIPIIIERARKELRTGAYNFLRTASLQAGGLSSASALLNAVPKAGPPAPSQPVDLDLLDFRRLRQLLDKAAFGEPLGRSLPSKRALDRCAEAASAKSVVPVQQVDEAPESRAFAKAVVDTIQTGWAELLTGRATPADILNTIFSMAEVALDKRHSASAAERAAFRFGPSLRHEAFLAALPRASEAQVLTAWGEVLGKEHPYLATKLLEEETKKEQQPRAAAKRRDGTPLDSGAAGGGTQSAKFCLLWGLGLCTRHKCSFLHSCPYKGSACGSSGGCLLRSGSSGHLHTFQKRDVREKLLGQSHQGSAVKRERSRSPRQRPRSPPAARPRP